MSSIATESCSAMSIVVSTASQYFRTIWTDIMLCQCNDCGKTLNIVNQHGQSNSEWWKYSFQNNIFIILWTIQIESTLVNVTKKTTHWNYCRVLTFWWRQQCISLDINIHAVLDIGCDTHILFKQYLPQGDFQIQYLPTNLTGGIITNCDSQRIPCNTSTDI